MRMVVLMRLVPDVVEEIVVAEDGCRVDRAASLLKVNEFDEQALEQALLLREATAGEVVVVAVETGDVDEVLCTGLAKGAARAFKVTGPGFRDGLDNEHYARAVLPLLGELAPDVVLVGVQANDDLDGQLAGWLAGLLRWPLATVVSQVTVDGDGVQVQKEFAGGRRAMLWLPRPAVLGIQASPTPPRYVPVARIRQLMKRGAIEERTAPPFERAPRAMALSTPRPTGMAEMLDGDAVTKASRLADILLARGVLSVG